MINRRINVIKQKIYDIVVTQTLGRSISLVHLQFLNKWWQKEGEREINCISTNYVTFWVTYVSHTTDIYCNFPSKMEISPSALLCCPDFVLFFNLCYKDVSCFILKNG